MANEFLHLDLDKKDWQFTLTDVAIGRTVATSDISPAEPTSATVETARNPAFGTGQQREYDLIHAAGKDVWVHSCGCITPLIPRLIEGNARRRNGFACRMKVSV